MKNLTVFVDSYRTIAISTAVTLKVPLTLVDYAMASKLYETCPDTAREYLRGSSLRRLLFNMKGDFEVATSSKCNQLLVQFKDGFTISSEENANISWQQLFFLAYIDFDIPTLTTINTQLELSEEFLVEPIF